MAREYKDSGIEWIGQIPKEWEVCQIRRVMKNRSERNLPNAEVLSLYRDWGIVPKNSRDDNHNVTSEDTTNYKVVHKGDFVINKMKAWQGSMAVSDYDGIISPAYYVCEFVRTSVYKRYIHHLLRNESYKTEYMRLSSGLRVGQWDLNIENFLRIPMILPSFSEQQKIADYLDKVCGEIDEMVALQETMIEELKAYKQSVITEAVTKGLNPNVSMCNSGIDWIGEIPEHWEVCRIKNILVDSSLQTSTGKEEQLSVTQNKGIIKTSEIQVANPSMSQIGWKIVNKGDIVFNKYKAHSGVFFVSPYNGIVTFNYSVYHCCEDIIPHFYEYLFKTPPCIGEFRKAMKGVGESISPLYTCDLFRIAIFIPPLAEQQQIVSYLNSKCSEIESLIALKQAKIEELKEYKKSVIYEYVTGKKEVC